MKVLPRNVVLRGDAPAVVSELLPGSVDAVITSPPYFQLRDYGSRRQLGREASVDQWVAGIRAVCHGLARVLKPTGSVWLNVADTYSRDLRAGAPPKGLLLGPERLLLALAADGWLVRNKVVWAKRNPLPQSARDRLSNTWEPFYLLTRQPDYYFDLDALRVPAVTAMAPRPTESARRYLGGHGGLGALKARGLSSHPAGKNPGDVWTLSTAAYRGAHFATFPEALIERPILASVPERICEQCDQPWRRPTRWLRVHTAEGSRDVRKVGELQRCDCFAPTRPGIVLDPFFGTGTVGAVAERLGRDWLGIELNPAYAALAEQRLGITRRAA
jgi:DNA modification methylase